MYPNYQSTLYAPAERAEETLLMKQSGCIMDNSIIRDVLNAVNIHILIINKYRQIVYANETFLKALQMSSVNQIIGKRPGEAVGCIHADRHIGGCGTSEVCMKCNGVNLILKSMKSGQATSDTVAITYRNQFFELPMNMFENVTPVTLCDDVFYIISLIDISDTQRRRILERLFFHDILNTSGALKGLVGMLKEEVPRDLKGEVEFVEGAFNGLVEEIMEQKQILDGENSELAVDKITLHSDEIIESLVKLYEKHELAVGKNIQASESSPNVVFKSDYVLLKRVLGNMLKNALEASDKFDTVIIGSRRLFNDDTCIEFWVWNRKYIPEDIQLHIFQRSFSTKGASRGMGTYSMKLFGERYLKGKVGFESTEEEGTRFFIQLGLS